MNGMVDGRLEARVPERRARSTPGLAPGTHGVGAGGRHLLWLPQGAAEDTALPLLMMLHGAGGSASGALALVKDAAESQSVAVLALQSRGVTWDRVRGAFGPDVEALESTLEWLYERVAIDPARVALGGFSDGASYALSLGLGSGDAIRHVIAFSPGFAAPDAARGRPRIYVSHGTQDQVLPIAQCSRRIVPELVRAGYDVTYREFQGGHSVPPGIAREAMRRIADRAEEPERS